MNSKLFCCVSVWRNLFLKTASHFRFSFSILAESNVSNNNAPSENLFVHFVTTRFNISSTDAAKMLKKAPSLGQLKTLDNVEQFICVLNRNGCTEDQIAKIIRLLPRLLGSSVVEPKIQLLKDSGLKGVNLAKIVTKNPCVLTTKLEDLRSKINFLQTVFPTQDFLIKAITRNPSVLKSSLQKTLEPSVAFWENFGFRGIELTKFLLLNLWVLTHSSLTAAQLDFIRKIGLQKESKMYKNVVSVVANSRIEVLEAKVDNLQLCGLSRAEAWELVRVYPPVLNHSEENVKKKMDFMLNHMELSVDFVIKHTRMFSMSLDKVIRPRFSVLQNMASMNEAGKVNPMRLTSIFLMPEAKFVGQIIQGHPKSAALWTVYKKCHG